MEDELIKANEEYQKALSAIQKAAQSGCPGGAGRGQEARLGQAYQWLVRLGVKPKLRGKYRG